jgi:hypothetical protein
LNAPKETERFFSCKRGYRTLKSQLVADENTEEIICVFRVKGSGHDWLFGLCYAMDGGYKGWNPYIGLAE